MVTANAVAEEDRRNEGSKRLGTFMLSGWVLTDTPCVTCHVPTVRRKDRSIVRFCVLCNHETDPFPPVASGPAVVKEKEEDYADIEEEELEEMMHGFNDASDYPSQAQIARDSISSLLGQKMLQGWTMMQDCCPNVEGNCNGVPLMRNKQMQLFCVSCNAFVGNHDSNTDEKTSIEKVALDAKEHVENAAMNAVSSATPSTLVPPHAESYIHTSQITMQPTQVEAVHATARLVLEEKIGQLASLLKSQSHPTDILQTSQAIHSCAQALAALKSSS